MRQSMPFYDFGEAMFLSLLEKHNSFEGTASFIFRFLP
jgi:hypothetical protein